jgi:DNA topoisomerase III
MNGLEIRKFEGPARAPVVEGLMETILCVAEKPSIANGLARLLGTPFNDHGGEDDGEPEQRSRLPLHHVRGQFQGRACIFRVTSVAGHVYTVDFPPEFQNWDKTDPASLFSAPIVRKGDKGVVRHLEQAARGIAGVILWLDNDREGENICFEVLRHVHVNAAKVWRAKFSALTEQDVRRAMASLVQPDEKAAKAVDVRQDIDLRVGVAFTRFQSQFFADKYGDLNSRLVSYGPCQTPTLGFCVARADEIQQFKSEQFWRLDAVVDVNGALL